MPDAAEIIRRLEALPGHDAPRLRRLRREVSRAIRGASATEVVQLAEALLQRATPARRFLAYELIAQHPAARASLGPAALGRLAAGLGDWAAVDTFACYLAGPAWREGQISDALVHRWARSPDRWWRRVALVSTVPLNVAAQGGSGDSRRTLAVCRLLVHDRDDMVVKALSWALRALVRREPGAVRRFLATHEAELAPRVVREVRRKLATGRKSG